MKVRAVLNKINECLEKYPDFLDWDIYTEQPDLDAPNDYRTIDEEIEYQKKESELYNLPFNKEWIESLKESKRKMDELEKTGWKFVADSEGWVYRQTASMGEDGCFTIFTDKKIFTINNNY